MALIRQEAELRADPADPPRVVTGPNDDYLVALAGATRVSMLVSGDVHLTGLEDQHPPVVTPARLVDLLASGDRSAPPPRSIGKATSQTSSAGPAASQSAK